MAVFPGYALVIGTSAYDHPATPDVSTAAADASAIATVLRDPHVCGYPAEQVALLCAKDATSDAIFAAFNDMAARVGEADTVLVFYSGAVVQNERDAYCLVAADTQFSDNQKAVPDSAISQEQLLGWLQALPTRRALLIFDTAQGLGTALPADLAAALLATGEGRMVLNACRANQHSLLADDGLSLFGAALRDTLRGDGVASRGRVIGVSSLYTALYQRVSEMAHQRYGQLQEPELTLLKNSNSFPIALYQQGSAPPSAAQPSGVTAVREVEADQSNSALRDLLGSRATASMSDDGDSMVSGDQIDARGSQGSINKPSVPVPQDFGTKDKDTLESATSRPGTLGDDSAFNVNVPPFIPAPLPPEILPPVISQTITNTQQRRLEAAMPRSARIGRATEVRAMLALPTSEGLRRFLPTVTASGDIIARDDVAGRDVAVAFPNGQWTTVYVALEAPDFDIVQPVIPLRVGQGSDSGVATFVVTPHEVRPDGRVVVNLFEDEARRNLLDSLTLMIEIKGRSFAMVVEDVWQLVTSTVKGSGQMPLAFAAPASPPPPVYINVNTQTVVQGDQINLSGTFQGSNINIKSSLVNASQSIGAVSDDLQTEKTAVQQLLQQLNDALQQAPAPQQNQAETVATLAQQLVTLATSGPSNPTMLKIMSDGLRQTAAQLAVVLPPVDALVASLIERIAHLAPH